MTQNERIKAVRDTIVEIDEVLLRAASRLANLQDPTITDDPVGLPTGKRPLLESGTYSVHWRRRRCYLSRSTSYKLLARLLKRPDRYVSYDHLLQDVWENRVVSHETIRSADLPPSNESGCYVKIAVTLKGIEHVEESSQARADHRQIA